MVSSPRAKLRFLRVCLLLVLGLIGAQPLHAQITVTGSNFGSGTYELLQFVNFSVTIRGDIPFNIDDPGGATQASGPFAYILYVDGTDIYGNPTIIEVRRGLLTGLRGVLFRNTTDPTTGAVTTAIIEPATSQTIDGVWQVPNDGTLHKLPGQGGYGFVMAIYADANFPTTNANFRTPLRSSGSTSPIHISVTPDIRIGAPGATYRAGLYQGGDIMRFTTIWRNNRTMDNVRESRPLRPVTQDAYVVNLRLSTDPEYRAEEGANDDFNLLYGANGLRVTGDLGLLPVADKSTEWRKVTVTSTPGRIPPYGILIQGSVPEAYIPATQRDYTPQPDDGYLDIGESVELTTENLVPDSYEGRYFVASDVRMDDPDLDARPNNNTFVSNAANKVEVLAGTDSTVEPASAILDQNGNYIQGGNGASDFGSISDGGNFIAFASRAENLLVPSNLATAAEIPAQFRTLGQQIFLRNRQMRETRLASRNAGNQQANADCFNPAISANGEFVAFESAATNLVDGANTGGKSMIYVYDVAGARPIIVSRNRNGELANGDSMNPSISESGRFVAFESTASNLDLPQFTAVVSGGRVTSATSVRAGAGYNPTAPAPSVTISAPQLAGGVRATAVAVVENGFNGYGTIRSVTITNPGSGYTSPPTISIAPPPANYKQVYLHDRNVDGRVSADGNPIFDVEGNTATYLVSVNAQGAMAGQVCNSPVVNMEDDPDSIARNGGMFVAFVSYARTPPTAMPLGTGYAMVYRTLVRVSGAASGLGAVRASVTPVSVNDANEAPTANGFDPSGALIVPYAWEPAMNGDGSQVAFTSAGTNLVFNPESGGFDADTNLVPDVFVRNLDPDLPFPTTVRVSVSQDRVATGTIVFAAAIPALGNIPVNQPALGDYLEISDGLTTKRFTFAVAGGGNNVPIGSTVEVTRNSLVAAINGSGLNILAEATTPPSDAPNTGYKAGIYLKNTLPGKTGNVPILFSSAVLEVVGMDGGGTQAEDAPDTIQGVPFGSNQPSIDRTGRFVAYRSVAQNMDVHVATDSNSYPESPITGELIRPLIVQSSNVYLHDRLADGDESRAYDQPGNYQTTRMSVSKFGYPAIIFGSEPSGVDATTSANSSAPALSPDARFVVFSSDSEGAGGLIYGPNNLSPLDNSGVRDVLVHDRVTVGDNPPIPSTKPVIELLAPANGLSVAPNTPITISATARADVGKTISSVDFYVNNVLQGSDTTEPFSITYTVPTTGEYLIRAVATDSAGLTSEVFATIYSARPPAGAPFVQMTQPIAGLNFVTGSKLFLNALATASEPASIVRESVRLSVNGIDLADSVGRLGDTYGVLYTPTEPFVVDTYRASATDTANVSNQSAPLFSFLTLALSPLPEVEVLPFSPASQINAGQTVQLVAEAFFPQTGYNNGRIPERVEFYVNKVYVGEAVEGEELGNGRRLYTLEWEVRPEFVDTESPTGLQTLEVYARAVALNWQTNTENNNVVEVYGSVVDGPTPLTVYFVPEALPAGSNQAFVKDTFQKLFLREPTYDEYSYYLSLMEGGDSQASVVVQMAQSEEFNNHQQVLFGYYVRMGLKPTSTTNVNDPTSVSNLLNLMTNGTNTTLLPSAMSAGISNVPNWSDTPPYGATVGEALVASRLIGTITNTWNGVIPRNLDNASFMNWMRRSFNQPYLPQSIATNVPVAKLGDDNAVLATIGTFPSNNSPALTRFGYSYAFMSGLYDSLPLANVTTNSGLRTTLSNFPALVQGAAVSYLLSPTGQWPTNASGGVNTNAMLSTNLVASNLPPQITSTNKVTATVGVAYTNFYRITANNVGAVPGFGATNLPPGLTNFNPTTGVISGTPTAEGNVTMLVSATNSVGTGTLAVAVTILPPAPQIASSSVLGTNELAFSAFQIPVTPTNTSTTYGLSGTLPPGLFFTATNGTISGTPLLTNVFTDPQIYNFTMFATNTAGAASNSLTLTIYPAPTGFARYTADHSLSGASAGPQADPDGDGYNNATEFAFGMRPDQADRSLPVETSSSGDAITIRWTRRASSDEVNYQVVHSTSLTGATWTALPSLQVRKEAAQPADLPDGYERVSVTVTRPADAQSAFYRIKAQVSATD